MPLGHPMQVTVEWSEREWLWQAKFFSIHAYCLRNDIKLDYLFSYGFLSRVIDYRLEGDRERIRWLLERMGKENLLAPIVYIAPVV